MTRPNRLTVPVCDPKSLKPDLDEVGLVSAPEKIFDAVKFTSFLNNCYYRWVIFFNQLWTSVFKTFFVV